MDFGRSREFSIFYFSWDPKETVHPIADRFPFEIHGIWFILLLSFSDDFNDLFDNRKKFMVQQRNFEVEMQKKFIESEFREFKSSKGRH